jgi:pimeloyl-ACP methyl ester carboxylesterase
MKTFTHGRISMAYRDEGEGPAVVFIHNGGTSSTIWRHQIDDLSSDHRTIAVDLPGFGASPIPRPAATLDELVESVGELIRSEELAPALLVGNCMGTNIALQLAERDSSLVSGVLGVNPLTAASFSGGKLGMLHKMEQRFPGPTGAVLGIARKVRVPRAFGGITLRFQLGRDGVARGLHRDPELLDCQARSQQLPALIDVLEDMPAYGGVDGLQKPPPVPTWIVWGEQNRVLSRRKVSGMAERLGAEQEKVLDNCGHLAMMERPEEVTALIRRLDEEVRAGATEGAVAR